MLMEQRLAFHLADGDDSKLTARVGVSAVQPCDGAASSYSPSLSLSLSLSALSLSVGSASFHPFGRSLCSPRGIPLSSCIFLSPSVSSCPLQLTPAHGLLIRHPAISSPPKTALLFCCSGPTDSTSRINRARAALNSSSRPKS